MIRQHGGDSIPAVFRSGERRAGFIRAHVKPGTVVNADEASSWDALHARFEMKRIDHGQGLQLGRSLHELGGDILLAAS